MQSALALDQLSPPERRAFALLLVLPAQDRDRLFQYFSEPVRQKCRNLLERANGLSTTDLIQVALEELESVLPRLSGMNDDPETAANPPEMSEDDRCSSDERPPAACTSSSAEGGTETREFSALLKALIETDPKRLAAALANEPPRLVAGLLAHFPPDKTAAILPLLPASEQVFLALLRPPELPGTTLAVLAQRLLANVDTGRSSGNAAAEGDQLERVLFMVRSLPAEARKRFLAVLKESDPEFAEQVTQNLYVFEDLLRVADSCIQKILGDIELRVVATALSGAPPELKTKIASNLSKRVRESLFEEMEMLGALPPAKIEEARREFVKKLLELDEQGALIMTD